VGELYSHLILATNLGVTGSMWGEGVDKGGALRSVSKRRQTPLRRV